MYSHEFSFVGVEGDADGDTLGELVGDPVGDELGALVGDVLGLDEGDELGFADGLADGLELGLADGETLGDADGEPAFLHDGFVSLLQFTLLPATLSHVFAVGVLITYPVKQWYVATTGFVASYANGDGVEYVMKPRCGAGSPAHADAIHVGGEVLHELPRQRRGILKERAKPLLHVNVAVDPWL